MSAEAYRALARAQKLADRGIYDQAEEHFRKALRGEGNDAAVKGHFSLFLARLGKYEEALKLSLEAKQADGLYGLSHARVLLAAGKSKDALAVLREFTESSPENLLGWGYLAVALLASGKGEEAARVLSEHPLAGDPEMRAQLIAEAEKLFRERGIKCDPKDLLVYANRPRLLLNLRRQLQARSCVSLGMRLLDQDEPEAAAYLLRSALVLHPEQPVAGFYLGLTLLQMERPEEAAEAFKKVPDKSRLVGESKACLGVALYYSGKHKEAIELLEKDADDEVSYYFLGLSHVALGERGKAVKEFTQALKRDPSLATERLARLKELFRKSSRPSG